MEDPDDRRDGEAGIGQELRGAGDASEVDHPLQVRRPARSELAGEMLPAHLEELREKGSAPRVSSQTKSI